MIKPISNVLSLPKVNYNRLNKSTTQDAQLAQQQTISMPSAYYPISFKGGEEMLRAIGKIEYSKNLEKMEGRTREYLINFADISLKQITPKFLDII